MAGLPKFFQEIKTQVVDPSLEMFRPFDTGVILRSYYKPNDKVVEEAQSSPVVLIDVAITGNDGTMTQKFIGVPVPKIFGLQGSLPPAGSTVLLAFTPENRKNPLAIAIYDGTVTIENTEDQLAPKLPPRLLTK